MERDLEKSICESAEDFEENFIYGKNNEYQPFDFFTSRKTKHFFKEDVMNIARAITNKDYIERENKKATDLLNPNINKEFLHSEIIYNEYLKKREDEINRKKKSDSKRHKK